MARGASRRTPAGWARWERRCRRSYRSFAWPGAGSDEGSRIIAGLEDGALLRFQHGGDFDYLVGGGGNASGDAAFVSPEEGWIAAAANAGANSAQVEHVTSSPAPSGLQAWPLPFRRPLTAIAPQPGSAPGDPGAQALAVGDQGQIARYLPGEGWTREFLYQASGAVATPRLRGIAWPEAGRAYAVGDEGAMWLWRSDTGLWEPDPAKPLNFHANLTAVAFSAQNPSLGYAVAKQGVLLAYDKTWTQQPLPEGLGPVNLTSIAFAGGEALATYRAVDPAGGESGGLIVNEGSGWRIDPSAQALLASLPDAHASVLSKVSGLPDGGAVAAGPGVVIERDSASAPWRFSAQPLRDAQNISALAAIRSGSSVQALVSVDLAEISNPNSLSSFILDIDNPIEPGFGQPALQIAPDPLPVGGYLLRETVAGWQDLESQAYPNVPSITNTDLPNWPDAVLALDVDPSGARGWAVGGQTGGIVEQSKISGAQFTSQSAAALRLGGDIALPQSEGAPIPTPGGQATFALGGNAQCAGPCAALANEGTGPDAWLSSALARAAGVSGLRAFLYSGARVAGGAAQALSSVPGGFAREQAAYRGDLQAAGALPVYVAPAPSDADAGGGGGGGGGLATFSAAMGADAPAGTAPAGTPVPPAGSGAYAFESAGSGGSSGGGGTVRVLVLDFSAGTLGAGELGWLAEQLVQARDAAHVPVLVMGNADIADVNAPNYDAQDAAALAQVLLNGGASAYLFDSVGENRAERLGAGANAIPALGSGTLGYVPPSPLPEEFLGASGFVLASVNAAARDPAHQPRARQRHARPQHLPTGDRPHRRHPAAPQSGRPLPRPRPPPRRRTRARRRDRLQQRHRARPLRAHPRELHRLRLRPVHRPRLHLHLLAPGHRQLRRAGTEQPQPPRRRAQRRRQADSRSPLRSLLRLQRRHHHDLHHHRRPHLLPADHRPGRQRRAALRHRAARQPPRKLRIRRAPPSAPRRPPRPPPPAPRRSPSSRPRRRRSRPPPSSPRRRTRPAPPRCPRPSSSARSSPPRWLPSSCPRPRCSPAPSHRQAPPPSPSPPSPPRKNRKTRRPSRTPAPTCPPTPPKITTSRRSPCSPSSSSPPAPAPASAAPAAGGAPASCPPTPRRACDLACAGEGSPAGLHRSRPSPERSPDLNCFVTCPAPAAPTLRAACFPPLTGQRSFVRWGSPSVLPSLLSRS